MYDLIIIGGGPAGSSAGRIAGQKGLKTLLLEKADFPRYKPCGGALSEHAMSYLDFEIPQHLIEREIYGARVHFKNNSIERQKEYRIAVLVNRSNFDAYLLAKAKETEIEVKLGEQVIDIQEHIDDISVFTTNDSYRTRFVIIAEGAQGKFKRLIRKKDTRAEFGICIVTEIEASNDRIDSYIHNSIDIHFGVAGVGYGWIFPHKNCFNVGIGGFAKYLSNPLSSMESFLKENGFREKYRLHGHVIPSGGIKRTLATNRMILVGDSAGFVDPFYGEGIAYAIRSGQIAVEIIFEKLKLNKKMNLRQAYELRCQRDFGENLKYSLLLTRLMHLFPAIFIKLLSSNEGVLDKYLEVPALRTTYKDFIKWLIPRTPGFILKTYLSKSKQP